MIVFVGWPMEKLTRKALLTVCWEHDGYWPMVDAARRVFATQAHLN